MQANEHKVNIQFLDQGLATTIRYGVRLLNTCFRTHVTSGTTPLAHGSVWRLLTKTVIICVFRKGALRY